MATCSGIILVDGIPRNGVEVRLYASGAPFATSPPQKGTAFPASGQQGASVTSGTAHGADGAYRFTGISAGTYYAGASFNGTVIWDTHNVQADTAQANVKQYGAVGDGVAVDTAAFQAALDDTAIGELLVPPGIYRCGNLTVTRTNFRIRGTGGEIRWTGTTGLNDQIGFQLVSSNTNVEFEGLRVTGDDVAANGHAFVWAESGAQLTDVRILNNRVVTCVRGVSIDTPTSCRGLLIQGNCFDNMAGTGSRQGEGIYFDESTTSPVDLRIIGNEFNNCDQFDIHLVRARNVVIANNQSRSHRSIVASGTLSPCFRLSRPQNVIVEANLFHLYSDGAIEVTPSAGVVAQNIIIRGNQFIDPQNAVTSLQIGTASPSSTGTPQDVLVLGNQFYQSGRNIDAVTVNSCLRLKVTQNQFTVLGISSGSHAALRLRADGESGSSATYTQSLDCEGNQLHGTTSGGSLYLFNLSSTFCGSAIAAQFRGNRQAGATATFLSGASIANDNLGLVGQSDDGVTFDGSSAFSQLVAGTLKVAGAQQVTGALTVDGAANVTGVLTSTGEARLNSGVKLPLRLVTGTATAADTDFLISGDATGGAFSINLPTAVGRSGKVFVIYRISASNNVTVDPNGSESINGALTKVLASQYASISLMSDGVNWVMFTSQGTVT